MHIFPEFAIYTNPSNQNFNQSIYNHYYQFITPGKFFTTLLHLSLSTGEGGATLDSHFPA